MVSVYPILSNVFTSQITLGTFLLLWIINICCKMKLLNLRTESKLKFQPKEYVHCAYLLSYKYYILNAPSLGLGNFFQRKFKFWKIRSFDALWMIHWNCLVRIPIFLGSFPLFPMLLVLLVELYIDGPNQIFVVCPKNRQISIPW